MDKPNVDLVGPAQRFRQQAAHRLHQKMLREDPRATEALLQMFAEADTSLLIGHKAVAEKEGTPVHLVLDDTRRDAAQIIGTEDLLWSEPISLQQKPTWQAQPTQKLLGVRSVPETNDMNESELKLYWASYFKDPEALQVVLDLFLSHRQQNLSDLIALSLEPDESDSTPPVTHIHSLGKSPHLNRKRAFHRQAFKAKIEDTLRGWLQTPEVDKTARHQSEIRALHGRSGWRNKVEHALRDTSAEVVQLPKAFRPPAQPPAEDAVLSAPGYHAETPERIGPVFLGIAYYLANLPENLNWFSGINQSLYVPPEISDSFSRLGRAESACHTFRYTSQLESTVGALISYYYPGLVSSDSQLKARKINKNEAEYYTPLPEPDFEASLEPKLQCFTIDKDLAAKHFGREDGLTLGLTTEEVKHLWQRPAAEIVTLNINDKPRSLTVGVLRRWFHYTPDKIAEPENMARLSVKKK